MPHIRLRYAGLIGFAARVIGIFTGFVFITVVTRQLSEADFGIWVWITRLVGYTVFPIVAVNYWVTRYVARDLRVARTGLYLTLILASVSSVAYLAISPLAAEVSHAPLIFFIIASMQIPLTYVKENFDSVGNGLKPQVTSYGFLAFEATKVTLALTFMVLLGISLISAILVVAMAQSVNVITLYIFIRKELVGDFDLQLAKHWLRASWIPLYTGFGTFILSPLDAFIIIGVSGSSLILAYYGAAYVLYSTILMASILSSALYPKLLAGGGERDVEETLRLTVMFTIPMAAGLFTIARPFLYILNPAYVYAVPVVRVLVVYAFLMVLTNILDFIILGTEKVDLNAESKFRDFAKSRLFLLPTINLVYGVSYLVTLGVVTFVALSLNLGADEVAFYWALTQLAVMLPFFVYKGLITRRIMRFKIPWRAVSLYLAASLLMVAILQLLKFEITYTPSIYVFIFDALRLVGVGIGIYFLILYIFDPYFRSLVRSTLASFRP